MNLTPVFTAMLLVSPAAAECVQRFLIPLQTGSRPGAEDSRWRADLKLFNRSEEWMMFGHDLTGIYQTPFGGPSLPGIPPKSGTGALILANTHQVITDEIPAAIIGVRCSRIPDLEASISVYNANRQPVHEVLLPIISERDTFKRAIAFHDVPASGIESRTTIRIYDLDGHEVEVLLSLEGGGSVLWTSQVTLKRPEVGVVELQPSYVETQPLFVPDIFAGRLEIEALDGAAHRLWGMVSITSADSREVRLILPAGGSETWDECSLSEQ